MRDVLSELMSRRGYGRIQAGRQRDAAWREAVGPVLAEHSRIGPLRRGTLEIVVASAVLAQELTYQKDTIIERLSRLLPDEAVSQLKFRVGRLN